MNVFSLFASLKLDKSEYEKGLDEAEKKGNDFAESTEKKISPKVVAGWTAILAVIVKIVQAVGRLATESMNYADSIGDLAAQYGVSTDAISEMQYIADQSSTSVEQLTTAMSMLYMKAKTEGDAFKELGISVKDANGNFKSMDELFWETAEALNSLEDDGAKSAYMLDLFGRSAMNVGEVLRKSSGEIERMRQEAHDLGIVIEEDTINFASDWNDTVAVIKLQMNSTIASMVAGADDAEQRFDEFMGNILEIAEKYLPSFIQFFLRFVGAIGNALMSYAPTLIAKILMTVIDTIFEVNWFQVGVDIGLSILEGVINVVGKLFSKIFGTEFNMVDLGVDSSSYYGNNLNEDVLGSEYEISENINQSITVKVEASGDTTVSEETAEKTAQALAPYIDKILGGM